MINDQAFYLDFEQPVIELEKRIRELQDQAEGQGLDVGDELRALETKVETVRQEIYNNLTPWQKVQLSRHPQRPYSMDYIERMLDDFTEFAGDRLSGDDPAMVCGPARLAGQPVMVISMQNGRKVEERQRRNFGMPHPQGYRKALRLMKLAARFGQPIISLVDTSGAHPGIEAEEHGQAEAIARNLFEMSYLPTPIIVVIIGQGASGGALGTAVGDRILMMENAWYSVIAPESCSTILFRTRDRREEAADALKLTAVDLQGMGIIDRIVAEPFGGAHRNHDEAAAQLKRQIQEVLAEVADLPADELIRQRVEKFSAMSVWEE